MKIVCSVFDIKAHVFSLPFFSHSRATAIRDFHSVALDPNLPINKFPGDYELWQLGDWDEDTGNFILLPKIEFITKAHALISQE